ncbi:MAG TPA: hypothetical protein VFQ43_17020 [Nitrososphaera sp.]|nr:MAG: hypothetical protein E6K92_06530 [Nitrososphaerota archaeon]HEU0049293.1 hypothetical protein [Nitrososphaera sp.]
MTETVTKQGACLKIPTFNMISQLEKKADFPHTSSWTTPARRGQQARAKMWNAIRERAEPPEAAVRRAGEGS